MINGGDGTKRGRRESEQTSAQTGPWPRKWLLGTTRPPLGSPGSRHNPTPAPPLPDCIPIPPSSALNQEHLLDEPNPLPSVWFLTYPDTYGLCGNVRNYSHLEASTGKSGVASLNGSGPSGNCCSAICHITAIYRAPTNCGVRPALHTTCQRSPTSWSQANNRA